MIILEKFKSIRSAIFSMILKINIVKREPLHVLKKN